jgi:hypothetical protein
MRKIRHQTWQKRTAQLVALLGVAAGLAGGGQVVAHASSLAVPDISEWQGKLSANQVANLKNQVSFVINRRQYGSGYQDKDATNNTNLYTQYGIRLANTTTRVSPAPAVPSRKPRPFIIGQIKTPSSTCWTLRKTT